MAKIKVGSIETRQNEEGYKIDIELEPEPTAQNPIPNIVGGVTIFIKGNNQELAKKIESQVKRTINAYGKTGKK